MNSTDLHLMIDYLGSSGIVLSPEQKSVLQTSLVILKNEQKFNKVMFWGCIKGIKSEYYIVQGIGADEMSDKKCLYSKDCMKWVILPPPSAEVRDKAVFFKGRFTGDPSNEFEHVETRQVPGEGDEVHEEQETITIKEEDRLAAVIAEIDHDVFIVPRGSYIKLPTGQVITNRSFEGLTVSESAKMSSYFHFREPIELQKKQLMDLAKMDKSIDFLDSIETDLPQLSWSLQFDRGSSLIILKSLLWPGYVFYQVPDTRNFGSLYIGYGEYNIDLPFML